MGKPVVRPIFIPQFSSHEEARQVLSQSLQDLQRSVLSSLPITSYNGSRISGVGIPQENGDVVTLGYLRSVLVPQVQSQVLSEISTTTNVFGGDESIFPVFPTGTTFGPNLNLGTFQLIALSSGGPYKIIAPVGVPPSRSKSWTLIIQQDATGGRVAYTDPTYVYAADILGQLQASTWAICPMITNANGHTFLNGMPITDQPIP